MLYGIARIIKVSSYFLPRSVNYQNSHYTLRRSFNQNKLSTIIRTWFSNHLSV